MKPVNVVVKKSRKIKFIILQVVTILLVAVTLVSFSDVRIAPLASRYTPAVETPANVEESGNVNAELEQTLKESQKQVVDKQARINQLEKQLKAFQTTKKQDNASPNEEVLKNNIQQMQLQLTSKENKIKELEATVQNVKNTNASGADKALVDKLKTQVQQLETRNNLLVKLNNDLKKNNEYLASQLKAAGAGN